MTSGPIKIIISDDMEAHRRRLERILGAQDDMLLAASAKSGYEAVMAAALHQPDIVLLDIEMESRLAGIEAAKQIHEKLPEVKMIMLTVHKDDSIVFAAFQSGIVDYVLKTAEPVEIVEAIRLAHANMSPIRPIIAEKIRTEFMRIKKTESSLLHTLQIISELTPSELQVLKLLCENKTRKEIARERSVEQDTIKKQITSILKKFGLPSTSEVVHMINDLHIFEMLKKI
ncbi:response regulator transcription factor [Paenibacillus sp. J5C_2022]|uniref:response regulator transcription factor n=1 Tax=Paenibacillus sp. J5C2022 TaxID=2977129 RepID=UPI0021D1AF1C|nr:response regulator transcription factor [Paenibacillus sp. J5C2022]MCU6712705.1 response regulator transcription factor [Paenibacillus sp. J5C2022]